MVSTLSDNETNHQSNHFSLRCSRTRRSTINMNLVLKFAFLAVIVFVVTQEANAECNRSCRCKLVRECAGASGSETHYNFMPSEWAVKIAGRRNIKRQDRFCEVQCIDLLKSYLGDGYNYTIDEKPDAVVLDAFLVDIGFHRVCQSAKTTIQDCDFNLEYKSNCGKAVTSRYIGNTGCVVFQHDGGAGNLVTLKFAADIATTIISYLGEAPMDYSALVGTNQLSTML